MNSTSSFYVEVHNFFFFFNQGSFVSLACRPHTRKKLFPAVSKGALFANQRVCVFFTVIKQINSLRVALHSSVLFCF